MLTFWQDFEGLIRKLTNKILRIKHAITRIDKGGVNGLDPYQLEKSCSISWSDFCSNELSIKVFLRGFVNPLFPNNPYQFVFCRGGFE